MSTALSRTCRITGENFSLSETEEFLLRRIPELNPYLAGLSLPLPTVHPIEAVHRMYTYGGLRRLYRAKSVISGKAQLTRYNPELGTKICTNEEFFSDMAENEQYGLLYDFSRSFFEQWITLLYHVALPPLNLLSCEESDYCNGGGFLKGCYLCFACYHSRDCLYCLGVLKSTDCLDCVGCTECELCYSCLGSHRCYAAHNSAECKDCNDIFGCFDCRSLSNCYGCVNLRRGSYCIFNQQVSKEEYESFIAEKNLWSHTAREAAIKECRSFWEQTGHKPDTLIDCHNCIGEHLTRSENCYCSYNLTSCTNCSYLINGSNAHYCSIGLFNNSEFCYNSHSINCNISAYSYSIFDGEGMLYSAYCYGCKHCFGCIGLRNKSFCILNKQYTEEEYAEILPRIVAQMTSLGEWGEWFPIAKAPHSYEECSIHEFIKSLPLDVARARGYRMSQENPSTPSAAVIKAADLPDKLSAEDIANLLSKSISCSSSGKLFNFQKKELEFYLKNGTPLPRIHWQDRSQELVNRRGLFPALF